MSTDVQQEILNAFVEDCEIIVEKAAALLEEIDLGDRDSEAFAEFGGLVDGIMGCAKTMGLDTMENLRPLLNLISQLTEGCKALGYKAASIQDEERRGIVSGFLADSLEFVSAALRDLKKGYVSLNMDQARKVIERLTWIVGRMELSPEEQRELLKRFGLKA